MGAQGSFVKRFTDIFLSIIVLVITSPLLVLSAIAIRLESKGPALFIHHRVGLNGKIFRMYKFRGMVMNALEIGPPLTQENDPRLTRVGKFLRRTSIDEIPNFINVLFGDMSIVGPRPEITSLTLSYNEKQKEIFNYKPGVTGFSQVNGRQKMTTEERVEMEIEYHRKAGFFSDLGILFKTFKVVVTNEGNI